MLCPKARPLRAGGLPIESGFDLRQCAINRAAELMRAERLRECRFGAKFAGDFQAVINAELRTTPCYGDYSGRRPGFLERLNHLNAANFGHKDIDNRGIEGAAKPVFPNGADQQAAGASRGNLMSVALEDSGNILSKLTIIIDY
jgi:hypothetical protein